MKWVDLTRTLYHKFPVYPGDEPFELLQRAAIPSDGYSNYTLSTGLHIGTHLDGPAHMIAGEKSIDTLDPERFTGSITLIDVRDLPIIESSVIKGETPLSDTIVLFYSGWDRHFGTPEYERDHPILTESLAHVLVQKRVKMIGLDWSSPDREPYPVHKILLSSGITLLENLIHLDQLDAGQPMELFAFPLKIQADSAPVRAMVKIG